MASKSNSGYATLVFILLVGSIIMEIAIAGSFISYFSSSSGLGEKLAVRAFSAAQAGVYDAEIKISRNKEFTTDLTTNSYSLAVGEDSTLVEVSRTTDSANNIYVYTVNSIGRAGEHRKKMSAVLIVDETSGLTKLQSLAEIPL